MATRSAGRAAPVMDESRATGGRPSRGGSSHAERRRSAALTGSRRVGVVLAMVAVVVSALAATVRPAAAAASFVFEPPAIDGVSGRVAAGQLVNLLTLWVGAGEGAQGYVTGTLLSGDPSNLPVVGWRCEYAGLADSVWVSTSYIGNGGAREFNFSGGGTYLPAYTTGGWCSLMVASYSWSLSITSMAEKFRVEGSDVTAAPSDTPWGASPSASPSGSGFGTFIPQPYGSDSPPACLPWIPLSAGGCPTPEPSLGQKVGTLTVTSDGASWRLTGSSVALLVGQQVRVVFEGSSGALTQASTVRWGTSAGDSLLMWQLVVPSFPDGKAALWDSGACVQGGTCVDGGFEPTSGTGHDNYGDMPAGALGLASSAFVGPAGAAPAAAWGAMLSVSLHVVCRTSGGLTCLGPAGTVYTVNVYANGPSPLASGATPPPSPSGGSPSPSPCFGIGCVFDHGPIGAFPTTTYPVGSTQPSATAVASGSGGPEPSGSADICNPYYAEGLCPLSAQPPVSGSGCVGPLSGEVKAGIPCMAPLKSCGGPSLLPWEDVAAAACGVDAVAAAIGNLGAYLVGAGIDAVEPGHGTTDAMNAMQRSLAGLANPFGFGGGPMAQLGGGIGALSGADLPLVMHISGQVIDFGIALDDAIAPLVPFRALFGAMVLLVSGVGLLFWVPDQFGLGGGK
jgi:hypothetical protein